MFGLVGAHRFLFCYCLFASESPVLPDVTWDFAAPPALSSSSPCNSILRQLECLGHQFSPPQSVSGGDYHGVIIANIFILKALVVRQWSDTACLIQCVLDDGLEATRLLPLIFSSPGHVLELCVDSTPLGISYHDPIHRLSSLVQPSAKRPFGRLLYHRPLCPLISRPTCIVIGPFKPDAPLRLILSGTCLLYLGPCEACLFPRCQLLQRRKSNCGPTNSKQWEDLVCYSPKVHFDWKCIDDYSDAPTILSNLIQSKKSGAEWSAKCKYVRLSGFIKPMITRKSTHSVSRTSRYPSSHPADDTKFASPCELTKTYGG
ncbi:hypothetical protein AG1IA_09447 [Rhizoctonia solani AG-1 IA]|uniref:Uncharacterized protein n=1 Tax=Thanatephorus cucumeris (strain AG1-IA) TaxID=983506 RepID=L8WIA3_THACA|nr:hypothetical protein AG1IA_09447 [Rhizoctonia solani AG-1 IA]